MYKVFLFNKALAFLSPEEYKKIAPEGPSFSYRDESDLLLRYREWSRNTREKGVLYVLSEDPFAVWNAFSKGFRNILAAGGVVRDPEGRCLFIFRHNRWDLPKGKVEEGEDAEEAAVREVEEECGIPRPRSEGHLIDSYHIYQEKGVEFLKKTRWYRMATETALEPVPQEEEGITHVEWKAPEDWDVVRKNTFPSIVEVLDAAWALEFQ